MVHEWALAEAIVKTVTNIALKKGIVRVKSVHIVLGELQSIDKDILKYAIDELKKGTVMEDAEVFFEEEKAEFKCLNCNHVWSLDSVRELVNPDIRESIHFIPEVVHAFIKCPKCGSLDYEIIRGRGVWIKSITMLSGDRK